MKENNETEAKFFFARNEQELFYQKKTIAGLQVIGGCTYLEHLPQKSISTTLIPRFREISKHERYIEIGPGVTLSELKEIGERHIPKILHDAITQVANPFVRNIATIGGNICAKEQKLGLFAPLLALDAQVELKSQSETKFVSFQNFNEVPEDRILTTIRIPLDDWDVCLYFRLGPKNRITARSAGFAFLATSEKSTISALRIAFAGPFAFRCVSLENRLLGRKLPLDYNEIEGLIKEATETFDAIAGKKNYAAILKRQFQNLVRYSFEQLT